MFINLTLLFLVANASLAFILYCSIQRGQWLDSLFGWQKMLRNFDIAGTPTKILLHKILGGCELCFSHLVTFLFFWVYIIFMVLMNLGFKNWYFWIVWYFIYVPIGTNLSLYFITKLFINGNHNNRN